jgi:nucleoid-associated protein YgaU
VASNAPSPKDRNLVKTEDSDLTSLIERLDAGKSTELAAVRKSEEKASPAKPEEIASLSSENPSEKSGKTQTYVVRKGDTLHKIARKVLKDDSHSAVGKIFAPIG